MIVSLQALFLTVGSYFIFLLFRIYRSSSQSYPYPRTHTLVVVPPSRPIMESNAEKGHVKIRPPLNRTIPPIPESKSSDSIITHTLEKRIENHVESGPSTSPVLREPSCSKSEHVTSFTAKVNSKKNVNKSLLSFNIKSVTYQCINK